MDGTSCLFCCPLDSALTKLAPCMMCNSSVATTYESSFRSLPWSGSVVHYLGHYDHGKTLSAKFWHMDLRCQKTFPAHFRGQAIALLTLALRRSITQPPSCSSSSSSSWSARARRTRMPSWWAASGSKDDSDTQRSAHKCETHATKRVFLPSPL